MSKRVLPMLLLLCAVFTRAQAQSYLLVLNKAENSLAVLDGRDYRVVAPMVERRGATGCGQAVCFQRRE